MDAPYEAFQQEFSSLHDVLNADVLAAAAALRFEDSQYNRRVMVRSVFAALEGLLYWIRQENLRSASTRPTLYSPAELALLREESYELDRTGEIISRDRYLPFKQMLRFTLLMTAKRGKTDFTPDVANHGWQALGEAVNVRHRITHPKRLQELDVTDDELCAVQEGYSWAMRSVVLSLLSTYDSVMSDVARLKRELSIGAPMQAGKDPAAEGA